MKEKTLKETIVYDGGYLTVRHDEVEIDGKQTGRDVVVHPGGVGIALEDEEGRFFFVTQYRYAQKIYMLEYPAGKKEKGEDPLTTAKREIVEETGYEGKDFVYLGSMVVTPAYDTEVIDMYYAKIGEFKGQHLDEDEYLNVSRMTLDEITEKIVKGEVTDAKTICMTFLVREKIRNGR